MEVLLVEAVLFHLAFQVLDLGCLEVELLVGLLLDLGYLLLVLHLALLIPFLTLLTHVLHLKLQILHLLNHLVGIIHSEDDLHILHLALQLVNSEIELLILHFESISFLHCRLQGELDVLLKARYLTRLALIRLGYRHLVEGLLTV